MKKLKLNDEVVVTTGKNAGKVGKIISLNRKTNKVTVDGVNEVKRATKPSQGNPEGGFVTKNLPIDSSNVSLISPKTKKPTKVKFVTGKDNKKVRTSKKCGAVI
ncbi:MAG: 50S ribosomal protein L24 [Bacteriovorax sp.]|jgi:large subunit ribosomal protein L24